MKKLLPILILILLLLPGLTPPVCAGSSTSSRVVEYKLKAAYLLNFAKFTSWPDAAFADKKSPFIIGVLGKSPFQGALSPLETRTIKGRLIEVQYYKDIGEIKSCQLLFICRSEEENISKVLARYRNKATFTVSDIDDFIHRGGMLEFITTRGHLHFSINLANVHDQGLDIEAQLLSLANEVIKVNP